MLRRSAVVLLGVLIVASAPAPAGAEVTQEQLAEAEAKVREVSRDLECQLAEVDVALARQTEIENRIAALQEEIADRQRQMVVAEFAAREQAVALYTTAGTSQAQTVVDFEAMTDEDTRDAYRDALVLGERDDVNQLAFLQQDQARLEVELREVLAAQEDEREQFRLMAADLVDELEEADAEYRALYDQWWEEEMERRRIAEQQRLAAEAAARAEAARQSGYASSADIPPGTRVCPVAGAHTFRDSWGEPRPGGRTHKGVDMVGPLGTPLVAAESGVIYSPNWHYAGGIGLYLMGDTGDVYYYAHLQGYAAGISDGVRVGGGQVIGYMGETGNAAGPHLHLGYMPGGGPLTNPYQLMVKLCR